MVYEGILTREKVIEFLPDVGQEFTNRGLASIINNIDYDEVPAILVSKISQKVKVLRKDKIIKQIRMEGLTTIFIRLR